MKESKSGTGMKYRIGNSKEVHDRFKSPNKRFFFKINGSLRANDEDDATEQLHNMFKNKVEISQIMSIDEEET